MKLRSFDGADYDASTNELTIRGRDKARRDVSIVIPVADTEQFVASIVIAMMKSISASNSQMLMPFQSINIAGANNARSESWVRFQFGLASGAVVRLGAQIDQRSDADIQKVQSLFEAALQEMQRPSSSPVQ